MTFNQFYWIVTIPTVSVFFYFGYTAFRLGFFVTLAGLVFVSLFIAVQIEMINRND